MNDWSNKRKNKWWTNGRRPTEPNQQKLIVNSGLIVIHGLDKIHFSDGVLELFTAFTDRRAE